MVGLISNRLKDLSRVLSDAGTHKLHSLLESKCTQELEELLLTVNGIGPRAVENFIALRGLR